MVFLLPRKEGNAELVSSFGPLADALGVLAGGKLRQLKHRAAYHNAGIPENQAEAWSQLPAAQQQQAWKEYIGRGGLQYTGEQEQQAPTPAPVQPQQPFRMQPETLQRVGALSAMQQAPQMMQRQAGITNPLQAAYAGAQAGPNYQAQLATGNPQNQLQAATSGIQALQKAQLSGALGYQPQKQELAQQQMAQQKPVGSAPTLQNTGGIAPKLPSEGPRAQSDESGIPQEYRGLGLKPWQKPNRRNYAEIMASPKLADEKTLEKEFYKKQIKAKENISKKEKDKVDKIYKDADYVEKHNIIQNLRDLQNINKTGQVLASKDQAGWFYGKTINSETELAKDLIAALPPKLKAHLSIELKPEVREKRIKALLTKYENDVKKRNALEEAIDENNGWTPENVNEVVNKRAKANKEPVEPREYKQEQQRESPQQQENIQEEQNLTGSNKYARPEETNFPAQVVAPAVRAAESIGGIAGNVSPEKPHEQILQEMGQSFKRHGVENEPSIQRFAKAAQEHPEVFGNVNFPSTENIREKTKEFTGNLFEPTGSKSEKYQDWTSLALQLFNPLKGQSKVAPFVRAASGATAGILTREGLKSFDASPEVQGIGQFLGTIVGMGGARPAVKAITSKLYDLSKTAAKQLGKDAQKVKMKPLRHRVNNLWDPIKNEDKQGIEWLRDRVAGLNRIIHHDEVPIETLVDHKRNLSDFYDEVPKGVKKPFDNLYNMVRDEILKFGEKHPSFGESFAKAEALESGLHKAHEFTAAVEGNGILNGLWRGIMGKIAKAGITEAVDMGTLLSNNEIRNIWAKAYTTAIAGNTNEAINYTRRLKKKIDSYLV